MGLIEVTAPSIGVRKTEKQMISQFAEFPESGKMTFIAVIKLAKWAGSHQPISKKFLAVLRIIMTSLYTKNQADIGWTIKKYSTKVKDKCTKN